LTVGIGLLGQAEDEWRLAVAILITGGAGLMGSELARTFLKRGEKVIIFDVFVNHSLDNEKSEHLTQVKGDISNWPEVFNAVKDHNVHAIFHLAAMLTVASETNPWACFNVNALGTFHALEAARLFGVKKFIFTSSIGSYGVTADTVVTEETIQRPTNIYGITKVFGELLGMYYLRKFGIDFRCLRFPQIVVRSGFRRYRTVLSEND
jgi:nucleoside-diphosphate-sugar epimerase